MEPEEQCLPHIQCHIPSVIWHLNAKEEGNHRQDQVNIHRENLYTASVMQTQNNTSELVTTQV